MAAALASVACPAKWHLDGGESPEPIIIVKWHKEGGFREIVFRRNRLQHSIREKNIEQHHRRWISGKRAIGECVNLEYGNAHSGSFRMEWETRQDVRLAPRGRRSVQQLLKSLVPKSQL